MKQQQNIDNLCLHRKLLPAHCHCSSEKKIWIELSEKKKKNYKLNNSAQLQIVCLIN